MTQTRLLIANRGEIACRIIRTARRMGVHTIAVYSDPDANAPFVRQAHEAHRIGPAAASESYLNIDRLMEIATHTGTQMIHPGYGFLSENTELARRCEEQGIIFLGPPASAIAAMGDKTAAKTLMEKAGVPLVPGYHDTRQEDDHLIEQAQQTGYPLMIKASAGGGGKGMRVVRSHERFASELAAARREAKAAFGNDQVLLERFVERPRHVEVQVFFDQQGHGVYLLDRDCSIQRRHQKIIEEAPAPGLSDDLRRAMGEAAVRAGQAIDYVGAGTVEFLLSPEHEFFFMEMNTRLQVEHPVTEAITGIDLVEWQIRVGRGESLPWQQDAIVGRGHAVEARVYAENPDQGFLPTTGRIDHLSEPHDREGIRIDSGIAAGLTVTPDYDPMLSKVIAHGPDRRTAIERLQQALQRYELCGPITNIGYVCRALSLEAFRSSDLRTDFVELHEEALHTPRVAPATQRLLGLVAWLAEMAPGQAEDPWARYTGWRSGPEDRQKAEVLGGDELESLFYALQAPYSRAEGRIKLYQDDGDSPPLPVRWQPTSGGLVVHVGESEQAALTVRWADCPAGALTLFAEGETWTVRVNHPEWSLAIADDSTLSAPMHGRITALYVSEGDAVEAGAPLVVMEAMKMEHTITAPSRGRITAVHGQQGENVASGAVVIEFDADSEDSDHDG